MDLQIGPGRIVSMKGFSDVSPSMTIKYGAHKDHYTMFLLLGSAHKDKFMDFNPIDALARLGYTPDTSIHPSVAASFINTIGQDGTCGEVEIPDDGLTIGINATLNLAQMEALVAKMRDLQGDEAKGVHEIIKGNNNGDS